MELRLYLYPSKPFRLYLCLSWYLPFSRRLVRHSPSAAGGQISFLQTESGSSHTGWAPPPSAAGRPVPEEGSPHHLKCAELRLYLCPAKPFRLYLCLSCYLPFS